MSVVRTVAVTLTIPDNAALTARATLERLGVALGDLERADLYRVTFASAGESAPALAALRDLESLYNPNKHRWAVRDTARPEPGELWVAERDAAPSALAAGRRVPGVVRFESLTGWRLHDPAGLPAESALVRRAAETLLGNLAFQRIES